MGRKESREMRYFFSSLFEGIGIVIMVISGFVFASPRGVVVGALLFFVGLIIKPSRLTKISRNSREKRFPSGEAS
jgi:hypothetical protein